MGQQSLSAFVSAEWGMAEVVVVI